MKVTDCVAGNLRELRLARGWSQRELGIKAGYSAGAGAALISTLEGGRKNITLTTLAKVAVALGIEPVQLLLPAGCQLVWLPGVDGDG